MMKVIGSIVAMQQEMIQAKRAGKSIGFVPTMGYLHEGHLRLVEEAKKENDLVVMSIFVNPLQFGPNEDFNTYPRDFNRDEQLAAEAGVDYLFYPNQDEMYPAELTTSLTVKKRVDVLCGRKRIGHFDGVVTVVMKLFHIAMPDRAYFGLKDAQQVAVIQGMVADYNMPITIVPVPIVREQDGLAKSSRNVNLLEHERSEAPAIYKSLLHAKTKIEQGERNPQALIETITNMIKDNTSGIVDYVEIYSFPELEQLTELKGTIIIAIAVQFQKARLIDNIIVTV